MSSATSDPPPSPSGTPESESPAAIDNAAAVADALAEDAVAGDSGDDKANDQSWQLHPSELAPESHDPLLGSLVALSKYFGRPFSPQALTAGLPLEESRLTPPLFIRAASRAGLSARVVRRKLSSIPDVVMPVVLLLKDRSACVMVKRVTKHEAEIILPETGEGSQTVPLDDLTELYEGYAIFVRPEFNYQRQAQEASDGDMGSWFWGTLRKFWTSYAQVIAAALLINVFSIASPLFVMNVYDRVVPNQAIETLWVLATGITVVIGTDFLLRTLRGYYVDNAGRRADVLLSAHIFEHVLNIQMAARPSSSGGFANQLRDFETLRDFFTSATFVALVDLPFLFVFLLVIHLIGGPVVIAPAAAVPIVIVAGLIVQFPLRHAIQKTNEEASQKHGVIVETLGALETIKSLGAEGRMQREWERFVGAAAKTGLRARMVSQLGVNLAAVAQQGVTVGVIILGVYQIAEGNMTVGALIACTILTGRTMAPLSQVASLLSRLYQSLAALKTLNQVMALPVERATNKRFLSRSVGKGAIEFQNVTFAYPGSEIPSLRDVSFRVEPGERVGLLGPVGSGKTTISKLVLSLYEPNEGAVLIDGTDVRQIDPADIRRAVGVILQDVILFHGSVRDNISMGAPQADDEMIFRAATLAGVHDFVSRHPMGYDLVIGERGQTLSGGQRQSIALARALLPDPPVLVLDEPTSMMDMNSERQFMERLQTQLSDKTMLLITHRPSLFHLVDRLIVLGQGRIVADGPRDQILSKAKQASRARQGA